jgi:hypothetical protein
MGRKESRPLILNSRKKNAQKTADEPAVVPQTRDYGGQDFGELSRVAGDLQG